MKLSHLGLVPSIMWRFVLGRRLKPDTLRKIQNKKLRALIKHSYEHVPYYHSLFKEVNLSPDDIKTTEDLHKIPVTTKTDIVDLPLEKVVASNIDVNKGWILRTSGTTGIPLTVYWDSKAKLIDLILKMRFVLERGDKLTNKQVSIGGPNWLPEHHVFEKLGIMRTKRLSPLDDVKINMEQIKKFDPRTMHAFPSCIVELAKEIIEEDVQRINIGLIFTGGEFLDESTRVLARKVFDAEIFDTYGAVEVGRIYNECIEHNGYHTSAESVLVEITQNGESVSTGKEGEVTVTNLNNYAMPFIRYNLEDIGMLLDGDCSCGSCLPRMRLTGGRKQEQVKLLGGRVISSKALIEPLRDIQGVRQFQVIQEKPDYFKVQIVKGRGFTDAVLDDVRQALKPMLGDTETEVLVIDGIPRGRRGKLSQFISKVPVT